MISEYIGRAYMKFQVGYTPMTYALSIIGFLTFAKVWQSTIESYGIPFAIIIALFPIILFIGAFSIGHE